MSLPTAILWTIIFIADIVQCINGDTPDWVHVFCLAAAVLVYAWERVIED